MSDDGFEAWRVWPGLERADVDVPHRLLGLEAGERDPLAIVKAADRRATEVRTGIPADRGGDRDALLALVEAARAAMLAAAVPSAAAPPVTAPPVPPPVPPVAVVSPPAPPPVPPPVPPQLPPAVPHSGKSVEHAEAEGTDGMQPPVRINRRASRRRSEANPASLALSALLVAVVAVVAVASWPYLRRGLEPPRVREVTTRSDPQPAAVVRQPPRTREENPEVRPEPAPEARPERKTEPMRQPTPDPRPAPPREPAPMTEPPPAPPALPAMETPPAAPTQPPPPAVDVEQVRARVGGAITKAFAAIRDGDFGVATRELAAVADAALDDQQATDRLQRWRQLAHYAGAFPEYRDKALASAASTAATFDLGGRQIGVVEITPREFIYRDSRRPGMNQRASRDAIPPDIEMGLVEKWFAADGRAANHLFLGAAALSRREPDLARARREWETAAAGGEPDGRLLLELLDDPAVRGR